MSLKARLAKLEADAAGASREWPPLYLPPQLPIDDGFERSASPEVWRAFLLALEHRDRPDADVLARAAGADPTAADWLLPRLRALTPAEAENRGRMGRFALDYVARHGRPFRGWDRRCGAGGVLFAPAGGSWDVPAEPVRDWGDR